MKRKSTEPFSDNPAEEVFHDEKQLNLSVLWSRKSKSVLYLECGKDFLDILLSLLITPVGAVLKLLEEEGLSADIKHGQFVMYASLMRLDKSILCVNKDVLLDPPAVSSSSQNFLLAQGPVRYTCVRQNCSNRTNSKRELCSECVVVLVYRCSVCGKKPIGYHTPNTTPRCTSCLPGAGGSVMKLHYEIEARPQPNPAMKGNAAKSLKKGYVRKNHTYMLKDDLTISKCGTMSTVALLQSMKVESFRDLVTREIFVERLEILRLVRAALVSTTPLTDVFGSMFEKKTDFVGTPLVTKTEMLEVPLKLCLGQQSDNCETKENIRTMEQSSDEKVGVDAPQILPTDVVQQSGEEEEEEDLCEEEDI